MHRWNLRARRRLGAYRLVPRAPQAARGPLSLLSALHYFGSRASISTIAAYWGVTERTARRWVRRASSWGWIGFGSEGEVASLELGRSALKGVRLERVPADVALGLTMIEKALWGRIARYRAWGTRAMAVDLHCSRTSIRRALRTAHFAILPGLFTRFHTPVRLALRADRGQNCPTSSPKTNKKRSDGHRECPNEPKWGSSDSGSRKRQRKPRPEGAKSTFSLGEALGEWMATCMGSA